MLLAACEEPVMCTASVEPSIIVEIRDSVTGAPAASGATLLARDARVSIPTEGKPYDDVSLQWGAEQAGTFHVTVQKPGYENWYREDVRVGRNRCHVETARLLARLQPRQ